MPLIACPYCANAVTLPDPWTAPGFTCPHCRNTSAIAAPIANTPSPQPPWPSQQEPLKLPLENPPASLTTQPRRQQRAPIPKRDGNDEAKGKRMIVLGYAAFVAVPIGIVIAIAAWRFSGTDDKADPPDVAHVPASDPGKKKPETPPRRVTLRPPGPSKSGDKTPIPAGSAEPTDPATPPTGGTSASIASIAIAPEPHPAATMIEVVAEPMPVVIGIAPEPRAVRPVMAAPSGFTSKWEKIGVVEVRIAGVAVTKVPITNADMEDVDSPVPVLAIWIEVRTTSKSRTVELRRWQDALGQYCELVTLRAKAVERGRLGPGATLRTGLPYKQPVPSDGTPRQDILVFAAPVEGIGNLRLILEAERIGETGKIHFAIPESAWKK